MLSLLTLDESCTLLLNKLVCSATDSASSLFEFRLLRSLSLFEGTWTRDFIEVHESRWVLSSWDLVWPTGFQSLEVGNPRRKLFGFVQSTRRRQTPTKRSFYHFWTRRCFPETRRADVCFHMTKTDLASELFPDRFSDFSVSDRNLAGNRSETWDFKFEIEWEWFEITVRFWHDLKNNWATSLLRYGHVTFWFETCNGDK